MAPSRAFQGLHCLSQVRLQHFKTPKDARNFSDFVRAVADPSNKCQVYTSRSPNPYLNLSIEHYILQKSPEDSTILFLYTNRPSVVIGRNQNPWTECNLGILRNRKGSEVGLQDEDHKVQLVRRRSGGGTVYHDEGNVNYSVIMPTSEFDRDKHAEMVARALKALGVQKVRVNERHDIVVDRKAESEQKERPFKISGSAYKLTRLRSLHHGTCLLKNSNLGVMGELLRAPATPFIKAKGVESVRSSVMQVAVENEVFEGAVRHEFWKMNSHSKAMMVGRAEGEVPEIKKGVEQLMSEDWIYGQTPPFEFSINGSGGVMCEVNRWEFPELYELDFTARNGVIYESSILKSGVGSMVTSTIKGKKLHEIKDWNDVLAAPFKKSYPGKSRGLVQAKMARSMNRLFGVGELDISEYSTREQRTREASSLVRNE